MPTPEVLADELHLCTCSGPLTWCAVECALLPPPQVSTANLERVRKVKTRHQRLMARVATVREELERFLEDDDDMMKMCLSRRKEVRPRPFTLWWCPGLGALSSAACACDQKLASARASAMSPAEGWQLQARQVPSTEWEERWLACGRQTHRLAP